MIDYRKISPSLTKTIAEILLMFAYFTMAYVVGKKLSKLQLYAITLVYSGFTIFGILIFASLGIRIQELMVYRDAGSSLHWLVSTTFCLGGWVLSILFMMHTRNNNEPHT